MPVIDSLKSPVNNPEAHVPLRAVELQILISLSHGARHGYRILQDAESRGDGAAAPGLATLYRALRRLESSRLIRRSTTPPADDEDERRQMFELTDLGRDVVVLEIRRLAELLDEAKAAPLLSLR